MSPACSLVAAAESLSGPRSKSGSKRGSEFPASAERSGRILRADNLQLNPNAGRGLLIWCKCFLLRPFGSQSPLLSVHAQGACLGCRPSPPSQVLQVVLCPPRGRVQHPWALQEHSGAQTCDRAGLGLISRACLEAGGGQDWFPVVEQHRAGRRVCAHFQNLPHMESHSMELLCVTVGHPQSHSYLVFRMDRSERSYSHF